MTPHSLWTILIKLTGLSMLLSAIALFPQTVGTIINSGFVNLDNSNSYFSVSFVVVVILLFLVFCIWLCLYKTDLIIEKLSLTNHFREEKFDFNFNKTAIIKIAIIILGGLILVDSLPEFCRQLFIFLQENYVFRESPYIGWVIFYFIKTIIGYLLLTKSTEIGNWVENSK